MVCTVKRQLFESPLGVSAFDRNHQALARRINGAFGLVQSKRGTKRPSLVVFSQRRASNLMHSRQALGRDWILLKIFLCGAFDH
jgi:hypothetical protein